MENVGISKTIQEADLRISEKKVSSVDVVPEPESISEQVLTIKSSVTLVDAKESSQIVINGSITDRKDLSEINTVQVHNTQTNLKIPDVNGVTSTKDTSSAGKDSISPNSKTEISNFKAEPPQTDKQEEEEKPKGWPGRTPFYHEKSKKKQEEEKTFWHELTWKEKYAYGKQFIIQYLSESWACLPYLRRFLAMMFKVSPWRAVALVLLNTVNGIIPALSLRTKGNFLQMVCVFFVYCELTTVARWFRKEKTE